MAKSQKHGNKEVKKPKKIRPAPQVLADGLLGKTGTGAAKKRN